MERINAILYKKLKPYKNWWPIVSFSGSKVFQHGNVSSSITNMAFVSGKIKVWGNNKDVMWWWLFCLNHLLGLLSSSHGTPTMGISQGVGIKWRR